MKPNQYFYISFLLLLLFGFSIRPNIISTRDLSFKKADVINSNKMPFKTGEKLSYILHYGIFNAGVAEIIIKPTSKVFYNNRNALNMVGQGRTTGAVDMVFSVRDHYETYLDSKTLEPLQFIRRVDEGGYLISQDYSFNPDSNIVITQDNKRFDVPEGVQDMISAFYYARTLNFDTANFGDVYEIPAFVDNEIFYLKLRFAGRETIKLRKGKFRCLKFNPVVQEGRIFKTDEDLIVWVSDDRNKIPILAESKILVGSIKMELSGYEGLAHAISKADD
ncbi:MAG: DUF3108 domain-containing protein [Bacteroidetes bacterium]|nr:MAG: DUF3108 domain-containing protein [Bacteroidota bacterium]